MRTWSRCGGRVTPFFLRALLLDGKTVCGACKRAVYLCFLGCAEMRRPLLTELSAAGLLGVAVDKVTRCVAIPALLAVWEWRRQVGVSCAAKSSVSSLLCKKGLLYMGFSQYSSPREKGQEKDAVRRRQSSVTEPYGKLDIRPAKGR